MGDSSSKTSSVNKASSCVNGNSSISSVISVSGAEALVSVLISLSLIAVTPCPIPARPNKEPSSAPSLYPISTIPDSSSKSINPP